MEYVYRFKDNEDNIFKYIGIVWGKTRTLAQRINEHLKYDDWCQGKEWTIEYIEENINTRTDAEYFEAHFVSLYGTDKYYNKAKAGWGVSYFLPDRENDWKKYDTNIKEKEIMRENISEIDKATELTNELFSLKTNEQRISFGCKLRAKKNRHTVKSDTEHTYWLRVMDLINEEIGKRLFGYLYNKDIIHVFLDGFGQIKINLDGFGLVIYYPNNDTFEIPHLNHGIYSRKSFSKCLDDTILKINTYKNIFV